MGDMQKGVETTELMLTTGTNLTAVGELVSGPDGVKIQPPSDGRPFYLVRNSLSSLIKEALLTFAYIAHRERIILQSSSGSRTRP